MSALPNRGNKKVSIHTLVILLLMALLPFNYAIAEKGESIMFQPTAHPFTNAPQAVDNQAEKCQQMAKRIEKLKGKPQRRHAALERYRLACTDKP